MVPRRFRLQGLCCGLALLAGCGTLQQQRLSDNVLETTEGTVTYGFEVDSDGRGDALSLATMQVLQERCGYGPEVTEYQGSFKGDVKRTLFGGVKWVNIRDVECSVVETESKD